jgi:hypothetical protein
VRLSGARLRAFEWVQFYIARLSSKLCFFEMPLERRGLSPKKEKQKKLAITTNIKSQTSKQGIELQKKKAKKIVYE